MVVTNAGYLPGENSAPEGLAIRNGGGNLMIQCRLREAPAGRVR